MHTYKIGTAARLIGLDVATLRNWERRYGLVVPERSDGRQRLYSAGDLERLRLLKQWIGRGYSASEAHRLLQHQAASELLPAVGDAVRVREEARRVRGLVAAAHVRAAAEHAKATRALTRIASEATGENAERLKQLASQADERQRRVTALATESTRRLDPGDQASTAT